MIGIVLGELRFAQGHDAVRERRWVQVNAGGQVIAAVDLAGCRRGEAVLLLAGDTVRQFAVGCPGDWAVAAVLSGMGNSG